MSTNDVVRELLTRLKGRLVSGEIDEPTYHRQRDLIVADLSAEERTALGISATPQPATPAPDAGFSPRPGSPSSPAPARFTPGPAPLGPSGGHRGGVRTAKASLSDLDLQPGTELLGQWRLIRELGRGGFGAVFEAEEMHLKERQAVKVLDPAMVAKEELLARFRREVSLMRKLVHPRIVRVYDYREDLEQSLALISMELVAEGSIRQLVVEAKRAGRPVPIALAVTLLGQILEALAEAHRQGVIHRDVTPGNVLLAGGSPQQLLADPVRDPQVKLVDFGIAGLVERTELSAKSRVLGTAAYVAPEVLDASVEITPATDVYGAGAMAYELLTGELPSGRFENPRELRAEIPEEIDRFLMRLLERRPERRPSAAEARAGLVAAVEERRRAEEQTRQETARRRQEEALRQQGAERQRLEAEERRLRDEAERRRLEAQRQAELEAAQKEGQRQGASLKEQAEAERRAAESARAAAAVRQRQVAAEQARQVEATRLAEEARRIRDAPPRENRSPPSMGSSVRSEARRSGSGALWAGAATLVALVVAVIVTGGGDRRATRTPRPAASSAVVAAETWRDDRTGLLWTAKDNGRDITWDDAKTYCDNSSSGGFSDWRLPSIAELEGLYDAGLSKTYKARGSVELSACCTWSGDRKSDDSSRAWYFHFYLGERSWAHRGVAALPRALCVRRSGG